MHLDRRSLLSAGLGIGFAATAAEAGPRLDHRTSARGLPATEFGLEPNTERDQTEKLQAALSEAHQRNAPLALPPGRFRVGELRLPSGMRLLGAARTSILEFIGGSAFLVAYEAEDLTLDGIVIDGAKVPLGGGPDSGLVHLAGCRNVTLRDLDVRQSRANGISLSACSGRVVDCAVTGAGKAGLFSLDGFALEIAHNTVIDCANNGIQVWRSAAGEDATVITANRIERITASDGGSGQNGNGINVFRANGVLVSGNRIADCAYSAIRGNAASNIQMIANACARIGEVALYAEFGFEGALIASNLVDSAATGISVTNFNEGGRLAVIQGNMVRNLSRREHEPEDKRGEGIVIEADASVTGNVIENAPTAGLLIGSGKYLRDVAATGNLIRNSRIGILISAEAETGAVLVANNMISGSREGAIRGMRRGVPVGPDLARELTQTARVTIANNLAV